MSKLSNKGFALVPVLAAVLFLGLAGLAAYHYYPQKNNDLSLNSTENIEDVLAGTSNLDLNTFMLKNLLEVNSVSEFNKKSDALMFCLAGLPYQMGDYEDGFPDNPEFSQCAFFPRASRAQTITFNKGGKTMSAKAYTNVTFQALARKDRWNKYIVFVPNTGSTVELVSQYKSFKNDAGVVIMKTTPQCSGNAAISNCVLLSYIEQNPLSVSKIGLQLDNNTDGYLAVTLKAPNQALLSKILAQWKNSGVTAVVGGKTVKLYNVFIPTISDNGQNQQPITQAGFNIQIPANTSKITIPYSDTGYSVQNNTVKPYRFNVVGNDLILVK